MRHGIIPIARRLHTCSALQRASGGSAGQLSVWSLDGSEEATCVAQLDAHLGTVSGVAILASGQVASLESDTESVFAVGKLCVWTPVKGSIVR